MKRDPINDELIVAYLLGDLPEEKQSEVEDRAFQDEQYLQEILAGESDLIDEYVRGELSGRARQQFESRFLASAERRRKVEFARALASVAPEFAAKEKSIGPASAPARDSWPRTLAAFLRGLNPAARFSLAAAALLIVIGGSWLVAESRRLRAELSELRAEQQSREREQQVLQQQIAEEQAHREDLSAQLEREREAGGRSQQLIGELERELEKSATQPAQPAIVSLALWPGVSRSGGARPKLVLPQAARRVRIQIGVEPEDEYQSFRVELRAPGGQPVWAQGGLSARPVRAGRAVTLNLPASILKAGEYELVLKGVTGQGKNEEIGYHYFDVLKK
jgi:anti-sigma factor RsiW